MTQKFLLPVVASLFFSQLQLWPRQALKQAMWREKNRTRKKASLFKEPCSSFTIQNHFSHPTLSHDLSRCSVQILPPFPILSAAKNLINLSFARTYPRLGFLSQPFSPFHGARVWFSLPSPLNRRAQNSGLKLFHCTRWRKRSRTR